MFAFKCVYLFSSCQPSLVILFFLLHPNIFYLSISVWYKSPLVTSAVASFVSQPWYFHPCVVPQHCLSPPISGTSPPSLFFFFRPLGVSFLLPSTSICIHGQVRASLTCSNGPSLFLRAVAALSSQDINSTYWWGEEALDSRGHCRWPRVRRWSLWWAVLPEHWSKDKSETLCFITTAFTFHVREMLSVKVNRQWGRLG